MSFLGHKVVLTKHLAERILSGDRPSSAAIKIRIDGVYRDARKVGLSLEIVDETDLVLYSMQGITVDEGDSVTFEQMHRAFVVAVS